MKKMLAILMILALCLSLMTGCGLVGRLLGGEDEGSSKKGATEAAAEIEPGRYQATYCAIDGKEYDCSEDALIIEADGTGTLEFEGEEYALDWEASGSSFSFVDEEGSTFEGTVSGSVIEGVLDGMDYIFEKESAGSKSSGSKSAAEDEAEVPAAGDFEPVSGTIGDYEITVVGAELFKDTEDKDGIRVYWDFTNGSDETIYPSSDLTVYMEQEGFELNSTYCSYEDDVPEYGNNYLEVRPGVTIRCISEYSCKAEGDLVTFTLSNWYDDDESISVDFDPTALPGRPAEDLAIEPIADPTWTNAMSDEGDVGDAHVFIDTAEIVAGWDEGEQIIRVYFDYTNNGEEAASLW